MRYLLDKIQENGNLSREEWTQLIRNNTPELIADAQCRAALVRNEFYQNKVFLRGLIEISSFCRNNCFYCGIRAGNQKAERYRLSDEEILHCCERGYSYGFRTFVLQGGEDPLFDDDRVFRLIGKIKKIFSDCAVTLSLGERPADVYRRWREAGADRYLLRHESANSRLYSELHPAKQCLASRLECLRNLRKLHFQVGSGFMVGVPNQTPEDLADDFLFLKAFHPEMVGIGPFIPHCDTPFRGKPAGSARLTLFLLALIRLLLPKCLLPFTTALSTLSPDDRINGLRAGANVIMPNLSPEGVRRKYSLYDNKAYTGLEGAEKYTQLMEQLAEAGFQIMPERGDALDFNEMLS